MFQDEERESGILGVPLNPDVLRKIGVLKDFPPVPEAFRPDGDWTQSYRILACRGYRDTGNDTVGMLRIRRIAGDPIQLQVHQEIQHGNGRETLEIEMTCRPNAIASPLAWTLTGRRFDSDGKELADLGSTQRRTNQAANLTSDLSLFEAVQRLPFGSALPTAFDILDGMSVLRTGHRLFYDGERCFYHLGQGMLPFQYWLDEQHRLLLAVTQWRGYILDPGAGNSTEPTRTKTKKRNKA